MSRECCVCIARFVLACWHGEASPAGRRMCAEPSMQSLLVCAGFRRREPSGRRCSWITSSSTRRRCDHGGQTCWLCSLQCTAAQPSSVQSSLS